MNGFCPAPGVYENIPFAEYLQWDAMDKTALWSMRKSPAHFRWERDHPRKATAPMERGTLLDTLLFDGEEALAAKVMLRPDGNGNTKVVREAAAEADMTGRILVTADELTELRIRVINIQEHPAAAELLAVCDTQVSFVWVDPDTGIVCKGRTDLAERGGPRIAELKHTRNAEAGLFRLDVARFGYQIQGAMYVDGLRVATGADYNDFLFILGEAEPPYCANVVPLGVASIAAGRNAYSRWLERYKRCLAADEWPGYDDSKSPIDIPNWALSEEGIMAQDAEWQ